MNFSNKRPKKEIFLLFGLIFLSDAIIQLNRKDCG